MRIISVRLLQRLILVALGAASLGAFAPPAVASGAAAETTRATAVTSRAAVEARLLDGINAERAAAGRVSLRLDSRLITIARARSANMAANHYFGHVQPDGRTMFALLDAAHVRWYNASEVIALNDWPGTADSAAAALRGWMGSPSHHRILLSGGYNYIGIGLAVTAAGGRYWTGILLKGPDRTRPLIGAGTFTVRSSTATTQTVRLDWSGSDPRLQVLTAGIRDFQVQRRIDAGAWTWVTRATTSTSRSFTVARGHRLDVRVGSRDNRGNVSGWRMRTFTAAPLSVAPAPSPAACGPLQAAIDATPPGGTLDRTGCAAATGSVTIARPLTLVGGTVVGRVLVRASDVTLRLTEVRGARVPLQEGAVDVSGVQRFTLDGANIHDSGGACLSISGGTGHVVRDSTLASCGQEGFHLTSVTDTTLIRNRIHSNNTGGVDPLWEAGGGKATRAANLVFEANRVWANRGPGLWCDILCSGTVYRANRIWDNTHAGIADEVSSGALIEGNLLARNGNGDTRSVWWGANVLVSSSSRATIRNNTMAGSRAGIAVIGQVRTDWGLGGPYTGITLSGNTVIATERLVGYMNWGATVRATGSGGLYWYPKAEPSYCRFERGGCRDTLALFEAGRYLTTAERDAVLAMLP